MLVYQREHATAKEARQQEAAIRRLSRNEKLELIGHAGS
jgi:predicted GIY-YIG superfamily endonuclease